MSLRSDCSLSTGTLFTFAGRRTAPAPGCRMGTTMVATLHLRAPPLALLQSRGTRMSLTSPRHPSLSCHVVATCLQGSMHTAASCRVAPASVWGSQKCRASHLAMSSERMIAVHCETHLANIDSPSLEFRRHARDEPEGTIKGEERL